MYSGNAHPQKGMCFNDGYIRPFNLYQILLSDSVCKEYYLIFDCNYAGIFTEDFVTMALNIKNKDKL